MMSINAVNDELCKSIIVINFSANVMVIGMGARVWRSTWVMIAQDDTLVVIIELVPELACSVR
jgi:hypothetical protein